MKRRATAIDAHIGRRLQRLREQARISQERLADALGLTPYQIFKYEAGQDRISAGRLFEAAKAIGRPVSEFYDGLA